jgi:DNA polymerase III epsilon subunit-like protein
LWEIFVKFCIHFCKADCWQNNVYIIDIESNGAGYRKESIIEVAIFRYDDHTITDQFISLVNPESDITPLCRN